MTELLKENDLWLLSFYRVSEISGALFFGRLARSLKPGPIQHDMTKHFSDESQHAWYWTDCIHRLGSQPLKLDAAYQDQYVSAAGIPANLMEVLAITHVFERRVIGQYSLHLRVPDLAEPVQETFARIMEDEKWHLKWVGAALEGLKSEYGAAEVEATLARYAAADREVYEKTMTEHEERVRDLLKARPHQ